MLLSGAVLACCLCRAKSQSEAESQPWELRWGTIILFVICLVFLVLMTLECLCLLRRKEEVNDEQYDKDKHGHFCRYCCSMLGPRFRVYVWSLFGCLFFANAVLWEMGILQPIMPVVYSYFLLAVAVMLPLHCCGHYLYKAFKRRIEEDIKNRRTAMNKFEQDLQAGLKRVDAMCAALTGLTQSLTKKAEEAKHKAWDKTDDAVHACCGWDLDQMIYKTPSVKEDKPAGTLLTQKSFDYKLTEAV